MVRTEDSQNPACNRPWIWLNVTVRTEDLNSGPQTHGAAFATTHWSVVLAAGQQDTSQASAALEQLCRNYWYPIYAYVRRRGYSVEDAEDLTQAFFEHLVHKDLLNSVAPEQGRFRSFLLVCLKHFLVDEWRKAHRLIRGGSRPPLAFQSQAAEDCYRLEPMDVMDAESLYERRWAITVLQRVLDRLREQWIAAGKQRLFEELADCLLGEKCAETHAQRAMELGLTEGAVKMDIVRMREQYRELVREEIAHTVADPREIDDEMRHLFAVISR